MAILLLLSHGVEMLGNNFRPGGTEDFGLVMVGYSNRARLWLHFLACVD